MLANTTKNNRLGASQKYFTDCQHRKFFMQIQGQGTGWSGQEHTVKSRGSSRLGSILCWAFSILRRISRRCWSPGMGISYADVNLQATHPSCHLKCRAEPVRSRETLVTQHRCQTPGCQPSTVYQASLLCFFKGKHGSDIAASPHASHRNRSGLQEKVETEPSKNSVFDCPQLIAAASSIVSGPQACKNACASLVASG